MRGVVWARSARVFEGIAANTRGWLLRNVGCGGLADESNEQALAAHAEQARLSEIGLTEAYWVAQLDLIDGRLLAGDRQAPCSGRPRRVEGNDGMAPTPPARAAARPSADHGRRTGVRSALADAVRADAAVRGRADTSSWLRP